MYQFKFRLLGLRVSLSTLKICVILRCPRPLLQNRKTINSDAQLQPHYRQKFLRKKKTEYIDYWSYTSNGEFLLRHHCQRQSCSRQWITEVRVPLSAYTSSVSAVSQVFSPSRKHITNWPTGPHLNLSSRDAPSAMGVAHWFTWHEITEPLAIFTRSLTATFIRAGYTFHATFFKIDVVKLCTEIWRTAVCNSQAPQQI